MIKNLFGSDSITRVSISHLPFFGRRFRKRLTDSCQPCLSCRVTTTTKTSEDRVISSGSREKTALSCCFFLRRIKRQLEVKENKLQENAKRTRLKNTLKEEQREGGMNERNSTNFNKTIFMQTFNKGLFYSVTVHLYPCLK